MPGLTCGVPTGVLVLCAVVLTPPVAAQAPDVDSGGTGPVRRGERATSVRILPVVGSAPETGLVGGLTALRVTRPTDARDDTRPSTDQAFAAYTAKHQFRAFVSTDRWTAGNRWRVNGQLEYQRFPQPYFGIGPDAAESAEEWYEPRSVVASVSVHRRLARTLYAQLGHRFARTTIAAVEAGGAIATEGPLGANGGVVSQALGGLAWDSRDNIFAPASGTFAQLTAAGSGDVTGSDFAFGRYVLDARRYLRFGRAVVAAQAYAEATSGRAPFDQLALVGSGTVMRGYARGRFRDRHLAAAQAELRSPIVGRLGGAVFAGAGSVADRLSGFASSDVLPTYGAGLRWLLLPRERTTIRVDYGRGSGSSGLYIAFNEAF